MGEHLLGAIVFYVVLAAVIFWFRAQKRREKDENERKLLLENPDAWEKLRQAEGQKEKEKREWMGKAAQTGIGIALQLLKKK